MNRSVVNSKELVSSEEFKSSHHLDASLQNCSTAQIELVHVLAGVRSNKGTLFIHFIQHAVLKTITQASGNGEDNERESDYTPQFLVCFSRLIL